MGECIFFRQTVTLSTGNNCEAVFIIVAKNYPKICQEVFSMPIIHILYKTYTHILIFFLIGNTSVSLGILLILKNVFEAT